MEYERKALLRARDSFSPKADIAEVVQFVRALKIPGELVISFPGNTGIHAITFIEKEKVYGVVEK